MRLPVDRDLVRLDIEHHIASDRVSVRVTKIGEMPAKGKKGTKRDCHGMIETIADGLQGVLYHDDDQVDAGTWLRDRS
jgi:Holliday junction resolvase RusA-like endonuclease